MRLYRIPREFPEFSMFREIPEYSRFVATPQNLNSITDRHTDSHTHGRMTKTTMPLAPTNGGGCMKKIDKILEHDRNKCTAKNN